MTAPTYPSVVIQTHLTFTATRWGQYPTISFTNGATAGAEVVTVDSSNNITVQIQSGVTTMAQVKTAIEAHVATSGFSASDLVTVSIAMGQTATAVVTVKSAALSGGTIAAKASRTIGHLVYTAKSTGTSGNSTRIKYTSGATLLVSVASQDITVRLRNDGTTTNAQIKAAISAESSANALVDTASDGLTLAYCPMTNAAPDFVALSGGTAAAAASSGALQDLTFTSDATGTGSNGKTISYSTGATAGSEVVTVDGSGNANIQIENGVSTATQIKAACDGAAAFNGVAASGTLTITSFALMHLTKAAGTVTVVDYNNLAGATLTVAGNVLTEGAEWTAATSNDATADSLATAINALTEVDAANPAANAITVLAATAGTAGNAITLATSDAVNLTISGGFLTGGINAATINVNGTTLTESTDFNATSSNDQTATNIAAAIHALSLVSASALTNVVTVTADAVSTAGNSYVFTKTGSGSTISGSGTLAGGVDGFTVTISGTGSNAQKTVNAAAMTGAVAGTQPPSPNWPPINVDQV